MITMIKFTKKDILTLLIDALIEIIGERTSKLFSVAVMTKILGNMAKTDNAFSEVTLEKYQNDYKLIISDDVESFNDPLYRKSMKSLIDSVGSHLGQKKGEFISTLKKKLGNEYVSAIEKYGLNFHMLEMKFD